MKIESFKELVEFLENNQLSEEQINDLLVSSIGIVTIVPFPKPAFIERLKKFWEVWKFTNERPMFLESEEELLNLEWTSS